MEKHDFVAPGLKQNINIIVNIKPINPTKSSLFFSPWVR